VIGNKWLTYLELLHNGHSESEAFQELGLKRYWYAFAPAASECADMS
jgi:DNA-directed RNA polymerase subunit N (RpoN/RPB10)